MNKIILQLKDSSLRAWYIYPAKHPKSTHPKVMEKMMNKIILQLKDSSLRVGGLTNPRAPPKDMRKMMGILQNCAAPRRRREQTRGQENTTEQV